MISVDVKIDTKQFTRHIEGINGRLRENVRSALEKTVDTAEAFAKSTTLFRVRTGGLSKGFHKFFVGMQEGRLTSTAEHSSFLEEGTRPHIIRAKNVKVLRFVQNGAVRFAKFVRHPGTKPRPFMQQAADRTKPLFERLIGEAIQKAIDS